jgi:hypothetical protein
MSAKREVPTINESAYNEGYDLGQLRRRDAVVDVRYDLADAAKRGVFAEFKRGFDDGFDGKDKQP